MQIDRTQMVKCPCCESEFELSHRQEFFVDPVSEEQWKFLEEARELLKTMGIETWYTN